MRTFRYASLPGLPAPATGRPYEFQVLDDLRLMIPADHRGPDVAYAVAPEQEAWLDRWTDGLTRTWDCQWTFVDEAAIDRLLAALGPPLVEPPIVVAALGPAPVAVAALGPTPDGDHELVLTGGERGNRVEVARVGQVIASVGLCDGWPKPWDVVARRAADAGAGAFDALVAHWATRFPLVAPGRGTRARALAAALGPQPRLWVEYRHGGIDGGPTCRVLELGDRVAIERLGKRRTLEVYAAVAPALATIGPADVACGLAIPIAAELDAIAALGPPKARRPRRPVALRPGAPLAARLAEAFRRLQATGVLAMARVAGTQSAAWATAGEARRRNHTGAVLYLADHWRRRATRPVLHLYWACWAPDADPLVFAGRVVDVLRAVGVDAAPPNRDTEAIVVSM
ncbi:MAG: hypothetical protein IPL61_33800 [Myxococcales bacterium]|nr:hypothetical protein [Myxococcales bacterium]